MYLFTLKTLNGLDWKVQCGPPVVLYMRHETCIQIDNLLNLSRSRETVSREIRSRSSSKIGKHVREKGFFSRGGNAEVQERAVERNRPSDNEHGNVSQ